MPRVSGGNKRGPSTTDAPDAPLSTIREHVDMPGGIEPESEGL